MTAKPKFTLECDGSDENGEPCRSYYTGMYGTTTESVRETASRVEGWETGRNGDFCPDCKNDGGRSMMDLISPLF